MSSYLRMKESLPKYERSNALINDILRAIASELDVIFEATEQNYNELFIDTAIRALEIHERDLGISSVGLDLRQRREQITANYRALFSQTTEETLKSIVASFTDGDAEILPTDVEGVYEIKFTNVFGVPDNIPGLSNALDVAMPAHLSYEYGFIFNLYSDIETLPYRVLEKIDYETLLTKKLTFEGNTHQMLSIKTNAELAAGINEDLTGVLIVGENVG